MEGEDSRFQQIDLFLLNKIVHLEFQIIVKSNIQIYEVKQIKIIRYVAGSGLWIFNADCL
jgi:hypothetical protein